MSMFSRKVVLTVSKTEFVFTDDQREVRFRPVIYLSPELKKVLAVGNPPADAAQFLTVDVFGDQCPIIPATAALESMLRYGLRSISPGVIQLAPQVTVKIGRDIRDDLKGFAPELFRAALLHSGARKVEVEDNRA